MLLSRDEVYELRFELEPLLGQNEPDFLRAGRERVVVERQHQKSTRCVSAPSMTRFVPVVNDERGLDRKTTAFATSCGVAMRPVGFRASVC